MKLKTYRARTMAEALSAVKKDLGPRAVILHTRMDKPGGWRRLLRRPVVEIIATDEAPTTDRRRGAMARKLAASSPAATPVPTADASVGSARRSLPRAELERARNAYAATAPQQDHDATCGTAVAPVDGRQAEHQAGVAAATVMNVRQRRGSAGGAPGQHLATRAPFAPQTPEAQVALESELASIKRMVGQVLSSSRSGPASGALPEPLFDHYLRLIEAEVAREIADEVVGRVRDELTPQELAEPEIVRQTLVRHLSSYIPVAEGVSLGRRSFDSRPLTLALVGPTGVGKTTTVAKLAAAYKLRHGRKVGLITSDTYRIAAVDQLRTYANIIGLPLKVVLTPKEMAAACESMRDCDVILIDTAGRSQHNVDRLAELREFLAGADPHQTHLVLSSTASETVLRRVVEEFALVSPDHLIFTKLDEAVNFGVLVNIARRVDARLSYVTTGQEVPDQIEAGRPERLARLILDGVAGGVGG